MVTSSELNLLTVKQLGALAKELSVSGWHEMRKDELVRSLVAKSRSRNGGEVIRKMVGSSFGRKKQGTADPSAKKQQKPSEKRLSSSPSVPGKGFRSKSVTPAAKERKKDVPKKREGVSGTKSGVSRSFAKNEVKDQLRLERDLSMKLLEGKTDRFVLLVRDPFWLHAYWELNPKTIERTKVSMGHLWYTAVPIIRLFRLDSDGSTYPKRHPIRDVRIHWRVNNWYLDVLNPPSTFQAELGFLGRDKKFHSILSSNTVETPQRRIVDDLDKLDGNWRGVADDLGRIYKLSGGDANNQELKRVFEERLNRPMSAPLLSRYRVSQQGTGSEKTRRNFQFEIDADVIIHGKTDPSVQVTIRNEPIPIHSDGSFSVRFSIPEKRHVFPIEAEGNDGVEVQRVILTMERNTRILETLFQEHNEEE